MKAILYKTSLLESSFGHVDVLTVATVTLDNERWLHETKAASDLARALVWSKQDPASDLRDDALLAPAAKRALMKSLAYAVDMYNFLYTTGLY